MSNTHDELFPSRAECPPDNLARIISPIGVTPVNPLDIVPKPGPMGKLLIDVREFPEFNDGMRLACATPMGGQSYQDLIAAYKSASLTKDFSPKIFWETHFDTPSPDAIAVRAEPEEPILEYIRRVREQLIIPRSQNSEFDLQLPYDRAVAGAGRFSKHEFHWDGYHMAKGFAADGRWDLVLNIVGNAEYQIFKYGYPLNGSADFFASRPQPPYFSHMVRLLTDEFGSEALVRFLPAMEKEYRGYWMDGETDLMSHDDGKAKANRSLVRLPDGSLLNRYWDDADGPRYESYKEDVELGNMVVDGLRGAIREKRLAKLYKDLRVGASAGWDYSSRWMKDAKTLATINTTDILPVDLNSLLLYTEETLAMAYEAKAGQHPEPSPEQRAARQQADGYKMRMQNRMKAMRAYMRSNHQGSMWFNDYNHSQGRQTSVRSAATVYPMYVGMTNEEETFRLEQTIREKLLRPYGVATTMNNGLPHQWDGDERIWAPPNWAAARGLARMAHNLRAAGEDERKVRRLFQTADSVRKAYMNGIEIAYDTFHMIPEKHHGRDARTPAKGGEYDTVRLLGMSLETYLALLKCAMSQRDETPGILGQSVLQAA